MNNPKIHFPFPLVCLVRICLVLVALTFSWPMHLEAANNTTIPTAAGSTDDTRGTSATTELESGPPGAVGSPPTTRPAAEDATPGTAEVPFEETADLTAMKQHYGQDPTGARARLGLCGRGQGGQGCGQHRRYRGGNQWNTP